MQERSYNEDKMSVFVFFLTYGKLESMYVQFLGYVKM